MSGANVTMVSTGRCTIDADQAGDADYLAAPTVSGSFNINPQPPQITSGPPPGGTFGSSYSFVATASGTAPIVFSATGLPPGLSISSAGAISGTPTAAGSFTGSITASDGTAPDAVQPFTIVIAKAAQTITFAPLADRLLSATPFTLSATASSALPVSFQSLTPAVCTASGSTLTMLAPGTCRIEADQPGDADYLAAPAVTNSFTITAAIPALSTNWLLLLAAAIGLLAVMRIRS
ncbi:MAG TPA: hypothetical protein VL284_02960 [Thermoanaerobaculia bacterium]|nr:hypothetical protein [Thermoanaerobaculia bacterium]